MKNSDRYCIFHTSALETRLHSNPSNSSLQDGANCAAKVFLLVSSPSPLKAIHTEAGLFSLPFPREEY